MATPTREHEPGTDSTGPPVAAYRYSAPDHDGQRDTSFTSATSATGRQMAVVRDIEAAALTTAKQRDETARDYKGRYRMWPGLMLLVVLLGAAGGLISFYAVQAHSASTTRDEAFEKAKFQSSTIIGGDDAGKNSRADIVSDDGAIGNPNKYPPSQCELPDYQSKNGHIVAVSANGTEVPIKIKGINWFGMET
jgi:endoglucanase